MGVIDFTGMPKRNKAYAGANGKKISVLYDGEQYMLKFPPSGQGKRTELSYTNSCISEHIASTIFNMVGIPAQETILGTFDVGGKTKIVCACKDFTADGSKLFDFCSIKNTVIDSEHGGTGTELEDILDTIEKDIVVEEITLIGGGGKSPLWQQILADITEKPLCVLENLDEGTSFGAALIAGVGIGLFPDFSVTSRLLKMKNRVDPRQETFSLYRQEKEIFYDSYAQMKSLNDRLYACKMGF